MEGAAAGENGVPVARLIGRRSIFHNGVYASQRDYVNDINGLLIVAVVTIGIRWNASHMLWVVACVCLSCTPSVAPGGSGAGRGRSGATVGRTPVSVSLFPVQRITHCVVSVVGWGVACVVFSDGLHDRSLYVCGFVGIAECHAFEGRVFILIQHV